MQWIRENTAQGAVIASTWQVSGVWMPVLAERANVLGALQEAVPDYKQRREALTTIFTSAGRDGIIGAMDAYGAGYVFINGYEENALYPGASSRLSNALEEVYSNGYSHVYKA